MKLDSQAATDRGRVRATNEDRWFASDAHGLYAVADGMSDSRSGEIASQMFVDTVAAAAEAFRALASRVEQGAAPDREELLRFVNDVFQQASRAIFERARREPDAHDMATTGLVLGVLDGLAVLGHVGDSRAYLVRHGEARQLTADHTVFQQLLDQGVVTTERAADFPYQHLLDRSVGNLPRCQVDTVWLDVQPGNRFLLCTDGLTGHLDGNRLAELCRADVRAAVDEANRLGGDDNVTVVAVHVGDQVARRQLLDTDTRMRALNQLSLFRDLTFQEMLQTMKVVREQHCVAEDCVVKEGEPGDSMYMVAAGSLAVTKRGVVLASLSPGDHFGDLAFLDGQPRSASVVARSPTILLSIRRDDFQSLVRDHPVIASKLLSCFALELARRLRSLDEDYVVEKRR